MRLEALWFCHFQSGAAIYLAGDLLDVGDNIRLELFPNSLADGAFYQDFNSDTWSVPNDFFSLGMAFRASPTIWSDDLQGVVRLTALSGSINVDHIFVGVIRALPTGNTGAEFGQTFDFPSVPLPAALPLFATGLGALGLLGWRRTRKHAAQLP